MRITPDHDLSQPMSPIFAIGNVFENSPYERIIKDDRSKDADIMIANNSGMQPTPKKGATESPRE